MPAQENSPLSNQNKIPGPQPAATTAGPAPLEPIINPNLKPPLPAEEVVQKPAGTQAVNPPPPKKGLPKILTIIGVLIIALALFFVGWKLILPRFQKSREIDLTWWGLWEDSSVISPLISEYEQKNSNIKITYIKQSPQDYRERLTNALAKGNGPDIFNFHNTWVPMFSGELDNIPANVMSASEYAESYYPTIASDLASGAGFVGVPIGYDALTLYINEDIFEKAGKTPPTTWDDLRQLALEMTTKDEKGTITQSGVALGRTENVDHWPEILGLMILQNGADPASPVDKRAEDALTYFTIFSSVDGVWDETLPPSTVYFAAGKLAMYFGPSWRAFEISQQNPNLRFKTVPLPQLPKDNPDQADVSFATYWANGVWARSANKEAAWDFLKFVSSQTSLEKLYQNESKTRAFGEAYPLVGMSGLLIDHPILGSIIKLAPDAQSWYLVSRTFDGPTGINSQIVKYYEDAINAINLGERADKALETVSLGVSQVLSQYGLISP